MCGRYVFNPDEDFYERFQIENRIENIVPNFNVSPGQTMPVIANFDRRKVFMMTWGYVPNWAKNENKIKLINTRADSLLQKPSFKNAFQNQRCIVPASGFYEWQKGSSKKTPFYFSIKDQNMFSFAGIFNDDTYSIITTDADNAVSPIHDRMPVILKPEDESTWLDNNFNVSLLLPLLKPFLSSKVKAYPVSSKINSPGINSPDLIVPKT